MGRPATTGRRAAPFLTLATLERAIGSKTIAMQLVKLYGGHRIPKLQKALIDRRNQRIYQAWKHGLRSFGELGAMYHMNRSNVFHIVEKFRQRELEEHAERGGTDGEVKR